MDALILDLPDPEEARRPPMAMKDYADEFRANAVALYESTLGATYKSIVADLASTGRPCANGCCATANAVASPLRLHSRPPHVGGCPYGFRQGDVAGCGS